MPLYDSFHNRLLVHVGGKAQDFSFREGIIV